MSISSYRGNETRIPTPLGFATVASAIQTLRRANKLEFAAVCLFALVGLTATLIAVWAAGLAFDYGGILAAAG